MPAPEPVRDVGGDRRVTAGATAAGVQIRDRGIRQRVAHVWGDSAGVAAAPVSEASETYGSALAAGRRGQPAQHDAPLRGSPLRAPFPFPTRLAAALRTVSCGRIRGACYWRATIDIESLTVPSCHGGVPNRHASSSPGRPSGLLFGDHDSGSGTAPWVTSHEQRWVTSGER